MSQQLLACEICGKLRNKIAALQKDLQKIADEWFMLNNELRPKLIAEYDAHFRELEIQMQKITLEASDIGRRVELLGLKLGRGERITAEAVKLVNMIADKEIEALRNRFYNNIGGFSNDSGDISKPPINGGLLKMYRALAKKLHPDAANESDMFDKYWSALQQAFEKRDMSQMQALYLAIANAESDLSMNCDAPGDDADAHEALEYQANTLRQKLEREQRKISRIRAEAPFSFAEDLKKTEWIDSRRKKLEEQIRQKKREITRNRSLFYELSGIEYIRESHDFGISSDQKDNQFPDEDFFDSTYFGNR